MNTKILTGPFARVLLVLPFAIFGLGHLTNAQSMVGMVPAFLPMALLLVYLTGMVQLVASVMVVVNKNGDKAALALAALALVYALTIHFPAMGAAADDGAKMMAMSHMLKDLALAGGALAMSALLGHRCQDGHRMC